MRNFTRYLLTLMIFLLSSTVMLAQLTVSSSYSGKAPMLPESRAVLYEQTNSGGGTRASQDFEAIYDAYDCQGADDFIVPDGLMWNIQTVTASGTQSLTTVITVVNVFIYADEAGIPASTAMHSLIGLTCTDASSGILTIPIPGGLPLGPGHYWISVQDAAEYATYGQWYWMLTTSIYNSQACWRNPGNGFGSGAITWTNMTSLGYANTDFVYRLEGSSGPVPTCDYQIDLWDAFGDTWNGGYLDVLVDGVVVLDNITNNLTPYPSYGPVTYFFNVPTGGEITTVFTAGGWPEENYYYIYDSEGNQVWATPIWSQPPNIMPGQLYGTCPQTGSVDGYVFNYDGLAIANAMIYVENGPTTSSGPDGYYLLEDVNGGSTAIACTKPGYNTAIDVVPVVAGETVYHEFHLTQPNMVVNPLLIQETLNPNEYYTTSLNVLNNGNGPLDWQATINLLSAPIFPCDYSIALYDTFGDGWNGGSLDVLLNGVVVLDNITLASGLGPIVFNFTVIAGDEITTVFTPGSWAGEPYYYIYNSAGDQVWYAPTGSTGPPNIMPGQLYASCSGGVWLTMDDYSGTVPGFGGVDNIPTHLNAANTAAGEVYTGEVIFTSVPNVATITVPVTMIIMGAELIAPTDLEVELVDDITGQVNLSWNWAGDDFQFFMLKRNGSIIGTTTNTSYIDMLPDFGDYCYTVQAVYDEGSTAPAGPECIEWPNPSIFINPTNLEAWVWVDNQVKVYTTITNLGIGTLHYTFPDFAATDNLGASVTVTLPAGEAEAAPQTAVASGAYKAHPEGTYTLQPGNGGREGSNVLLVAADGANTIRNLLLAYGDLGVVDYYDARNGTPSLDMLLGYEVVVTWSNYTYNSASNLGNVLADYIDDGGRVLNMMFALDPSWGLQGRFINEGYSAMTGTGTNYSTACLGTYDPGHPIMEGISSVCDYYRLANSSLTSGSSTIAQWSDGSICVAAKDDQTVVSIGGYPGDSYNWTGQMPDLIHNAILWLSGGGYFIIAVEPATANVPAGESQLVEITYDATGFDPGTYTQELEGQSNDPAHLDFIINNTMHVYIPAQFAGNVYDMDNGDPLPGVIVTAGPFQTTTNDDGNYSMYVDEGEYDITFTKLGYMPGLVSDTTALMGVITPVSIGLYDMNYAPGMVYAEVMANDTWCEVTWTGTAGPYEIVMDDGEADDYFIYGSAGNMHAVKFTPLGYPATAIGGQIYVGDGSFPGPFLGTEFGIALFDDDGPGGLPGTMLDSSGVTVNNYGWVSFDWISATFTEGSFYLVMIQTTGSQNSAPIGVDTDNPTYFRSYSYFVGAPDWVLSPIQDFMMRAWVDGPEGDALTDNAPGAWKATPRVPANWQQYAMTATGTLPRILPGYERSDAKYRGVEGMGTRDVTNYRVARYSNFDPNGSPAAGTLSELATTTNLFYNDNAFGGLPMGWYAYGVKALYTSGLYSNYTISNIVGHLMEYQVTVNVTLSDGQEPINVEVELKGSEYPYETYFAVTPGSGTVVFDMVWRGHYDISAYKIGYDMYVIENSFINNDKVYNIMLSEKKYAPTCLVVDPVSLEATWCEPLRTEVDQDFEESQFPPAGWQSLTAGNSAWKRTNAGGSTAWPIPTWDSYYAVCNDDAAGSTNDGCCDYLITPPVDMRESEGYGLFFDSYYDGAFGQLATVEYSMDGGATWEVLTQLTPATSWTDQEYDLSTFSGANGPAQMWFAFHADDAGQIASGWAIDNVRIQVPAPAANYIDFWVFLDNAFEGVTTETNWNYAPLWYGETYTASVAARYTSGLSAKDYYTFFCEYLFPPDSLTGSAPDDAAILDWTPPVEYWPVLASAGMSYEDYLAANNLVNLRSNDAPSSGRAPYANINVPGVDPFAGLRDLESKAWACDALVPNMVTFTLGTPGTLNFLANGAADFISAADIVDGVYYATIYGGTFVTMDTATGVFTTVGGTSDLTGLAYDYTTETMYGVDFGGNLYTVDLTTGATTVVGNTGGVLIDCACDNSGMLYAVDIGSDVFGSIDKVTATFTTIANLPFDANYAQGMQADHGADVVYHAAYNNGLGAGQLYAVEQLTGTYTLIGNFQGNTEVDGFAMPYTGGPIGGGGLPENLLGYNVYRDMEFVAYTPHTPEGEMVHQGYIEEGLQPGIYQYSVTAVYDLAPYGYSGQTGESMHEGPAEVVVDFCYDLEFMETWALGNFDDNNWTNDASNWSINGQYGNPSPAAEFTWDPILTDYAVALESYPLCAVGMTEGKIWLDYDLKLDGVQPTGEEMLQVQVWNWDNHAWSTVAEYSNIDGSFTWMSEHINIKAMAMDKVFKVRFYAMGTNSINILSWFVDNVHIYRTCDAPTELTAAAVWAQQGIVLNWVEPESPNIDAWIHWDDGVNSGNSIGTGAAVEFDVAARWDATQLAMYEGASVTEIAFFPAEVQCTYNVRVWVGAGAANLVVDQVVPAPVIGEWNYVTLTTPVPVDVTQELWVGYYVNAVTGYPAGVDDGPAIDTYGNMMNFGGWQTLLEINPELDFNWNVAAHLVTVAGVSMPLSKGVDPYSNTGQTLAMNPNAVSVNKVFASGNGSRDLMGYNIYRNEDGGEYVLLDFTTETTYVDPFDEMIPMTLYCYLVSAVWESETDQCESTYSNEACELYTGIGDDVNANTGSFSMYPNPADDHVFITTTDELKRVTVYNALGQLVIDEITTGKQYELKTASYTIGVYMVRVESAAGVTTRTLTVQR